MKTLRKLPNSEDIMKEASSKLEKVKRERDIESIIFAKYEKYQKHLSLFEQKLSNSIFSQKLNINQKTFFKIYSFLEKFSKEEQISINDFPKIFEKKDEENENNLMNKVMILEKENEKIVKDYHIIKKENEVLKNDNEELKKINNKLNIQYVQLNIKIEAEEKNKKLYDEQINKFKNNIYILESKLKENNKIIEELRKKLKNYEEKIKLSLEKAISDKNFMNFYKNSNIKTKKVNFMYLIKSKQLNNVYDYLDVNDIINFRYSCKDALKIFNNEKINVLNRFYLNIIKQKNNAILKLNKYDIQTHYLTKLPQLENLIKIYSIEGKIPAQGLRNSIDNSLYFLNKVVKFRLGIKPSKPKNSYNSTNSDLNTNIKEANNSNDNSFFGGFKTLFGFGITNNINNNINSKTEMTMPNNNKNKRANNNLSISSINRSLANSKENSFISNNEKTKLDFTQSDEIILSEINDTSYGLKSNYEFDYNNPDDINKFLTSFLKSSFSVDILTDFITKLCSNYCELLFNSYYTLKEIHQINIVNKTLNERFKYFYESNKKNEKIIKVLNNENNNLKKNLSLNNNNINETKLSENNLNENLNIVKMNDSESYDGFEKKSNMSQMSLNIANKKAELYEKKYEEIKNYLMQYKEITKKENNELRIKIDLILKEKSELENKINNFNDFLGKLMANNGNNNIENNNIIIDNLQ